MEVLVVNHSRWGQRVDRLVCMAGNDEEETAQSEGLISTGFWIGPRSTMRMTLKGQCNQRGKTTLGPLAVEASDPLGLIRRRSMVTIHRRAWVRCRLSQVGDLLRISHPTSQAEHRVQAAAGGSSQEFRDLSEYHPGDEMRRIHWLASARHQKLMVRNYEPNRNWNLVLFLDGYVQPVQPGERHNALDTAVEAGASVAYKLQSLYPTTVVLNGEKQIIVPGQRGLASIEQSQRHIADIRPALRGIRSLIPLAGNLDDYDAAIVILSGPYGGARRALDIIRRSVDRLLVLTVAAPMVDPEDSVVTFGTHLASCAAEQCWIALDTPIDVALSEHKSWG